MHTNREEVIQTARLRLQTMTDADEDGVIELLTNEEIGKTFMVPNFQSREQAYRVFTSIKTASQSPEKFVYGIYLNGKIIGFLNDVEQTDEYIELGFVVHPDYKNHGYATEAFSAAMQALFALGWKCVKTGAFAENGASIRVMEKSGMTRLDEVTKIEYRGQEHDCVWFEKRAEKQA